MKHFILKILALTLIFLGFVACSDDDDDDPIVITYEMVISNRDSGVFYALDTSTGSLVSIGSITYNNAPLTYIRGIVYDPSTEMIYVTQNNDGDGKVLSVDPETLVATVINDNMDDDWWAVPGVIMNNNKILGTVYWDDYNDVPEIDYYTGLVWLNTDGTMDDEFPLMYESDDYDFCCGMAIVYGDNVNEVIITNEEDELIRADLNGNVTELITLNYVGAFQGEDYIKNLAWGNDDVLYAVTKYGDLGSINLSTGDFTFIAYLEMMGVDDSDWQGMTMIPEFVFEEM